MNRDILKHQHVQEQNILLRNVYNWMMIGLFISGLTAMFTSQSQTMMSLIFGNPYMIWVLLFIELGLVFGISAGMRKFSLSTARAMFILFSFVDGLTLAVIFVIYTGASIAETFLIAGAMFGVMSLYGYFTDTDLSSWGKLLFMALIGLIIAMVVNYFLQSSMTQWWISVIGVIIFTGLTAYDTQKIKQLGEQFTTNSNGMDSNISMEKVAIFGALSLYLDFINLFIMLLEFFGSRRN